MAFNPSQMTEATLRRLVDNLVRHVQSHPLEPQPKRARLQEAVAATLGWSNYHDAITTLRRKEPQGAAEAGAKDPAWTLPRTIPVSPRSDDLAPKMHLPGAWAHQPGKEKDTVEIPQEVFASLVLLRASESNRRRAFEAVAHANPDKPILVVSGLSSLIRNSPVWKQGTRFQDHQLSDYKGPPPRTAHILQPGESSCAEVGIFIEKWTKVHTGGLILFDVPPLSSPMWNHILEQQAHWIDKQFGVWIGISVNDDICPKVRGRLLGRVHHNLLD